MMFYSGKSRFSDKIEKEKKNKIQNSLLSSNKNQVKECHKILKSGKI